MKSWKVLNEFCTDLESLKKKIRTHLFEEFEDMFVFSILLIKLTCLRVFLFLNSWRNVSS
jgi:hypothetical protein